MVWIASSEGAPGSQRRNAGGQALLRKPVCPSVACTNRQDARDDASLSRQTTVGFGAGTERDVGVSEASLCRGAACLVLQSHAGVRPVAGVLSRDAET